MQRKFGIELEYDIRYGYEIRNLLLKAAKATDCFLLDSFCPSKERLSVKSEAYKGFRFWGIKREVSKGCRIEITTPATGSIPKVRKGLSMVLPDLKRIGKGQRGLNKNTGLHIHVDVRDLLPEDARPSPHEYEDNIDFYSDMGGGIFSIIYFFLDMEQYFLTLVPRHRRNCGWARKISLSRNRYQRIFERFDRERWESDEGYLKELSDVLGEASLWGRIDNKSSTLCLSPIGDKGTLEFRLAASSYCVEDIVNWARLCRGFVQSCSTFIRRNKTGKPKVKTFKEFIRFCIPNRPEKILDWALRKRKSLAASSAWKR